MLFLIIGILCVNLSAAKYKCGGLDSSKAVIVAGYTIAHAHWIWKGKSMHAGLHVSESYLHACLTSGDAKFVMPDGMSHFGLHHHESRSV